MPTSDGLVFWNTLGSIDELLNSEVGPDMLLGVSSAGVAGNPAFIDGFFGSALTLGPGSYYSTSRVRNAVLPELNSIVTPEQGTVEFWTKWDLEPVAYSYGVYRMFSGQYGLYPGICVCMHDTTPDTRLNFMIVGTPYNSVHDAAGQDGVNVDDLTGTWLHVAATWDRDGIDGSADTMRLYINGVEVADAQTTAWPDAFPGDNVDVGGGNDQNIAGKFAVDNLKIWNFAKTDFSDRFVEGVSPNPAITGTPGNDKLRGTADDDYIVGLAGNDTLRGFGGDDTLIGHAGADYLDGVGGDDVLSGGSGDDRLRGGGGDDSLDGQGGEDDLIGGKGDDTLSGGTSHDTLTGGKGSDRFYFAPDTTLATTGEDADVITDFSVVEGDHINLVTFILPDYATLQALFVDQGADTLIDLSQLSDGRDILVEGVTLAELDNSANFVL